MIIPLRITGGSQVMLILKKEGDDVMTTGPGARGRKNTVCCIYDIVIHYNAIVSPSSSVCVTTGSLYGPT